jgi:hypothetical protein
MPDTAVVTDTNAGGGGTQVEAGKPPETKTPATSAKVEGKDPKQEPGKETTVATGGGESPDLDDDDIRVTEKNGKKFLSLSQDKFKTRLDKHTKKELKELFGTSDRAEIQRWKKKYDEFEKDAEERKRAEMSERQKLEADRDAALSAKEIAERRAERAQDFVARQKTQRKVASVAKEHVHGDKLDMALGLFRLHLGGLSRKKLDELWKDKGKWGEWFKELTTKNPEFAKAGAPITTEAKPDVETQQHRDKKPASNGIVKNDKPEPSKEPGKKSARDMSKSELDAYMRSQGIKLPGVSFAEAPGAKFPTPGDLRQKA